MLLAFTPAGKQASHKRRALGHGLAFAAEQKGACMPNTLEPLTNPLEPPSDSEFSGDLEARVAALSVALAELQAAHATPSRKPRPLEIVLVVLLGVSLLVHALTVAQLLRVRGTLRDELAQAADRVAQAKTQQISYDLPIDQQLPINIDVPIKRSMDVPINTQVQIKQNITLPIDTALGRFDLPVPIDATVPINTTVPIAFDQTVNISTTVPIRLNVPVRVDLGSKQVAPYLDQLRQRLLELRDSL
jgi:hypothetical protein